VVTIISTCLVIHRLCKRGTSRELRKKVIRRHITFFLVYLICIVQNFEDQKSFLSDFLKTKIFNSNSDPRYIRTFQIIEYVFAFTGVVIAFIRLSEPFVYNHFLQDLKNLRAILCRSP
jgi:hypothetical protein